MPGRKMDLSKIRKNRMEDMGKSISPSDKKKTMSAAKSHSMFKKKPLSESRKKKAMSKVDERGMAAQKKSSISKKISKTGNCKGAYGGKKKMGTDPTKGM